MGKEKSNPYKEKPWYKLWPKRVPKTFDVPNVSCADVFFENAKLFPQKTALIYFDTKFSYTELAELASRFARVLEEFSVKKGDRVILYMQNIPAYIIAAYGCWKKGAVIVPMNPMLKEREIQYIINDSAPKVIVCEDNLYPLVKNVAAQFLCVQKIITTSPLDWFSFEGDIPLFIKDMKKVKHDGALDFCDLLEEYPASKEYEAVDGSDLAAISYTSGTTGIPKGAMTSHSNHIANAINNSLWYSVASADVFFGFVPWIHITGANMQTVLPFYVGGTLVTGYRFEPELVLRQIDKYKVTHGVGPITMFISLMNHPKFKEYDLSSFLTPISGGAPVPEAVINKWEEEVGTYIHNVMGLTESTAPLIFVPPGKRAPVDPDTEALSIGIPLPNVDFMVVDAEHSNKIVAIGETGEMLVKGPQIIKGYWNKPEETDQTFIDGWCHTGDIVKMDENGWIYLVDRKKDMIIASGYKIWPRELEDVIYKFPGTKEVLVVGVPDSYRGESPKAFIALKDEYKTKVRKEDVINFCKQNMATYKVPREIEFLDEVPKTVTGKVLRRVLREQEAKKIQK